MTRLKIYPFHPRPHTGQSTVAPSSHMAEPSLVYAPPYARVVDDQIAWFLIRHLHPQASLEHDVVVPTPYGEARLDFLVVRGRQAVGFSAVESDGTLDVQQDALQKSMVVASGSVDSLYAFYGSRLEERVADCLSVVAGWHPALFSPDGIASLSGRSTRISRSFSMHGTGSEIRLHYQDPSLEDHYGGERFTWPARAPEQVVVRRFGKVRTNRVRQAVGSGLSF